MLPSGGFASRSPALRERLRNDLRDVLRAALRSDGGRSGGGSGCRFQISETCCLPAGSHRAHPPYESAFVTISATSFERPSDLMAEGREVDLDADFKFLRHAAFRRVRIALTRPTRAPS